MRRPPRHTGAAPTAGVQGRPSGCDVLRKRWDEARSDADVSYRHWASAPHDARRDAYAVYLAALDREDAAATAYGLSAPA